MPDIASGTTIADLKPICPCPACGKPREVRIRCWRCCDAPCVRCGKLTGSAFLSLCIQCGGREEAEQLAVERWVVVVEQITVGKNALKRPRWADVPMHHRMKAALKALADYGLRAVGLPNVPPDGTLTDRPMEPEECSTPDPTS